jgi:cystathionine beta-lyase/cystathionine gamma-synthase
MHQSQASGFGAVLSFRTKDSAAACRVIEAVHLIPFAESLGGVETLITYPAYQTHGDIPKEMRDAVGVTEDLLRLSVGIEAAEDLMEDLDQALCK